ncbi:hypothetical protein BH09BAC5_BH09BAC5_22690 [soil metagenome]
MKTFKGIFTFFLLGAIISGCTPKPTFPAIPALTFKEFLPQRSGSDSLTAVFTFTDGDGDIGVAPTDRDSNFLMTVYVPGANGTYHVIDDPSFADPNDSIYYAYRIPHLTAGQVGLEGDIYVTLEHKSFIGRDTLQFNAFLLDQSHNKSNTVRTESVFITH